MKFTAVLIFLAVVGLVIVFLISDGKGTQQTSTQPIEKNVGKKAPDFSLQSYDGKKFTLSDFRGQKVVLFFNEGIMCYPACWNQIAALGTDQRLNNDEIISLSIVPDGQVEWQEAARKMPELTKGIILLDETKAVSQKYDMLSLPSSMHKGSMPGHTYVIIDQNGVITSILDDVAMGIQNEELVKRLREN